MSTQIQADAAALKAEVRGQLWKDNLRDYGLLGSLLLIVLFFYLITADHASVAPVNITNLIMQNSYVVIMALGMLLIIVGGNIDLSVGSIVGFVGAIGGSLIVYQKVPYPLVIVDLPGGGRADRRGAGRSRRLRQDAVLHRHARRHADLPRPDRQHAARPVRRALPERLPEHRLRLPARHHRFRRNWQLAAGMGATSTGCPSCSASSSRSGCSSGASGAGGGPSSTGWRSSPCALLIGKNLVFAVIIVGIAWNLALYRGLPVILVIMGALIALYQFVTTRTVVGRRIYALGGNVLAARLSGVKTERLIFFTFANMGLLAGLAGLVVAARLNSATPSAGNGFELDVIAACFIGGTSASGGAGKVMNVVIGALVHGRHEQRHVADRPRHLLAAGGQGPRAARRRVRRRLPEAERLTGSGAPHVQSHGPGA